MGPGFESRERVAADGVHAGPDPRASMGPGFESRERAHQLCAHLGGSRGLQWGPASRAGRGNVPTHETRGSYALQWGPASRAGRGVRMPSCSRKVSQSLQWGPASRAGRGLTRPRWRGSGGSGFNGARLREPGEGGERRVAGTPGTRWLQWGPASRAGRGGGSPASGRGDRSGFNGARLREPGEGRLAHLFFLVDLTLQWGPASRAGRGRGRDPWPRRGDLASMGPGFESRERAASPPGWTSWRTACFNGARLREPGEGLPLRTTRDRRDEGFNGARLREPGEGAPTNNPAHAAIPAAQRERYLSTSTI